jgi:phosphatidylserine/phosphatidylglycerophosphate/cardiolipin synthase-like enzyme
MNHNSVELVITIPEPHSTLLAYQVRCRTTLGVLIQLISQAKNRIIISSPFIQPSHRLADGIIATAIQTALQHGINIDILSTEQSLQSIDRTLLLQNASGKLHFFQPSANLIDQQKLGSHAKFCVADGQSAYVGSANLTSPGLSGQLELGLLVSGEIANQIEQFWNYAIAIGLFVPIH